VPPKSPTTVGVGSATGQVLTGFWREGLSP